MQENTTLISHLYHIKKNYLLIRKITSVMFTWLPVNHSAHRFPKFHAGQSKNRIPSVFDSGNDIQEADERVKESGAQKQIPQPHVQRTKPLFTCSILSGSTLQRATAGLQTITTGSQNIRIMKILILIFYGLLLFFQKWIFEF